jgi:hypothetical protein
MANTRSPIETSSMPRKRFQPTQLLEKKRVDPSYLDKIMKQEESKSNFKFPHTDSNQTVKDEYSKETVKIIGNFILFLDCFANFGINV